MSSPSRAVMEGFWEGAGCFDAPALRAVNREFNARALEVLSRRSENPRAYYPRVGSEPPSREYQAADHDFVFTFTIWRPAICSSTASPRPRAFVTECIIETKAASILEFIRGLKGTLWITFEEGTSAAWLYEVLRPHVAKVIVCDPRKNTLLKAGNKNDRIDARKLSQLLRAGLLTAVYHRESGLRTLRELCRSYLTVIEDLTRVMNRIKALYRSWAIPCAGGTVYAPRHRDAWLKKISQLGVRRRAEYLYQQLDILVQIRREARRELLAESRKYPTNELLQQIPRLGPIRVALLIGLLQTPHRFRTKRQQWAYCGLALETRTSAEYQFKGGQQRRSKIAPAVRGLNVNYNRDLKSLFKSAATLTNTSTDPLGEFYQRLLAKGMRPAMARLTLARKIAAIVLTIWKKGERFDPGQLKPQAA